MIRPSTDLPPSIRAAAILFTIALLFCFLYLASSILIPLFFAVLFALLLYPLSRFFERNGFPRILAIVISMLLVVLTIAGLLFLLSTQIYRFISNLPHLADKFNNLINDIDYFFFKAFNIQIDLKSRFVQNSIARFMDSGVLLLQGTVNTFITLVNIFGLIPMYVFLFLLYRTAFSDFILYISPKERHRTIRRITIQIQKVVQNYIIGMLIVMCIIATLNSTALYIIGVDYALFFGVISAILTLIPYIGVIIAGALPTLFVWLSTGSFLHALTVVLIFASVQFMEGNFITPRITGNKVRVNALTAILALVTGGFLWGPAGLVLFMPLVAILKVIFDNIESLKPYGMLMGRDFYSSSSGASRIFKMRFSYLFPWKKRKI